MLQFPRNPSGRNGPCAMLSEIESRFLLRGTIGELGGVPDMQGMVAFSKTEPL